MLLAGGDLALAGSLVWSDEAMGWVADWRLAASGGDHRWGERGVGFDEAFRRKWEFYLAYCEAGFAAGYLDAAQIRLEREVLL